MRIAVLGNSGSWYCGDIARAAHEAGHQCSRLDFERIAAECGNLESVFLGVDDNSESTAVRLEAFDSVIVRSNREARSLLIRPNRSSARSISISPQPDCWNEACRFRRRQFARTRKTLCRVSSGAEATSS